jgi:uncharacterized protein YkwD
VAGLVLVSLAAALWSDGSAWGAVVARAHKARHAVHRTASRGKHGHAVRKARAARPPATSKSPGPGVSAGPPPCADADLMPTPADMGAVARATICLINRERTNRGLVAFRESVDLDLAAAGHSQSMVGADYFSHAGASGESLESRIIASGYMPGCLGCTLGENVGLGAGAAATPREMIVMWMNQPDHRANILDPGFRDIGVGAVASMPTAFDATDVGATYTADFGSLAAAGG